MSGLRRLPEYLVDAGLVLLAAMAFPVAILLFGSPIALLVRFIASLIQRL